jgi:hypothetical protein
LSPFPVAQNAPEKGCQTATKIRRGAEEFKVELSQLRGISGIIVLNQSRQRTILSIAAASGRSDGGNRARGEKIGEGGQGGAVGDAIDSRRTEVALEGGDNVTRRGVVFAGGGSSVTVSRKLRLQQ